MHTTFIVHRNAPASTYLPVSVESLIFPLSKPEHYSENNSKTDEWGQGLPYKQHLPKTDDGLGHCHVSVCSPPLFLLPSVSHKGFPPCFSVSHCSHQTHFWQKLQSKSVAKVLFSWLVIFYFYNNRGQKRIHAKARLMKGNTSIRGVPLVF